MYGSAEKPLDPITLQTAPQILREGALKSLSGIARTQLAAGKTAEAKASYEALLPFYLGWWQSRKTARTDVIMCAQVVSDLADLADLYMKAGNTERAKEISKTLAEICSTTPIASDLKTKANDVYRHVFALSKSDAGISDEY